MCESSESVEGAEAWSGRMILVTGATGHVGRAVVRRLASCGHDVAAMIRDVETARRRLPRGTATRVGDYEDALTLRDAFAGIDELVLISSDGEATAVLRHHANAIEAAVSAGIRHITFTSIVDIDEASPFYFAPVYRDAERRLARCGVPATILRCGLYCDFILHHWLEPCRTSGEFALPAGDGRVAPISRDDVATAVAAAATEKSGATYTITGDQALDFGEIAADYGRAIGQQLRYRSCAQDEYLTSASARLDEPWPHAFATLCASIAEDRYSRVCGDFTGITGQRPESLRFPASDNLRHGTTVACRARWCGAASALPEIAVRSDQLVRDFGEGAKDLDLFLAGAEHGARGEAHRRILRVIPGEREQFGFLEAVNQPSDIRPVERACAHRAGLTG
ncbi:NAD-dependent epimerase/dehydratase family protein [Mesorhizobium sp. M1C.F.Ca.ET.193.01.1.1]|nr:NAD-dependent epimerase/dehydratase family protein [Mesorhizobium sp. M1C.F.Ca.ET.210.01.1.1]TGQ70454.1 NAD-dependent epimerase/dehydratase family protein [Mesorhizobium sp. M1C.F.Ca.ET.212.01.1.1]TGR07156.1 NAD-dependent epimerase/dehydratase family protein [Mesorhizobium sp. M1C.F.Ca.ET.204.01.1.1]TGR27727.1 NAD-dependent epimerase/dehydratase family protein [Mesorhizobium sp. M1C.F.Ca.ET.196.01.1.1]TGR50567.1 NAD-dependent epimerase/dehydratase family protein [Mesorhizobium sp. M1C.F.Ca.E